MKYIALLLFASVCQAQTADEIAGRLTSMRHFDACITRTVDMPGADEQMVYYAHIISEPNDADSALGINFIAKIDSESFTAYINGEATAKFPTKKRLTGNYNMAAKDLFGSQLPQMLGKLFENNINNAKISQTGDQIKVVVFIGSKDAILQQYTFYLNKSFQPITIVQVNSPGSLMEQTTITKYEYNCQEPFPVTKEELLRCYPN